MSDALMKSRIAEARRPATRLEPAEAPWRVWARPAMTVTIVTILVALGIANIAMRAQWHEVEDGVFWGARAEGVTAVDVAPGSAGDAAGIQRGDILLAVNGAPVQTAGGRRRVPAPRPRRDTRSRTPCVRLGTQQALEVSLAPATRASSMYFVLAAVGLVHVAGRRVGPPAAAARSGDAAFLLAVRRVLRRVHVLVQRPVRSPRLDVLLG